MIIRIQSSDGTKRIELSNNDTVATLFKRVEDMFQLKDSSWQLYQDRNKKGLLKNVRQKLKAAKLNHGDMLYLVSSNGASSRPSSSQSQESQNVVEDPIDLQLWKEDGRIKQSKSAAGIFKIDDLPTEPWDELYLKGKEIKFMSFHAYMRQQTAGVDKGKYFKLENFRAACKMSANGTKHSVVDLPSAVTLNRQKYRHIDNIMFENRDIVDRFLNFWRVSGHQRMGYLYGRYTQHSEVPLGIKAEVCAIYEPPQDSSVNSLQFHDDPMQIVVDEIATKLGLVKVGWIITDLIAQDRSKGTVKNFRNSETHFLTAEECITAAYLQNKHLNSCRLASNGKYGSKFTTVVVSGDKDYQISFEGYQVSNQGMSLVADDCLIPTIDAPELGYVRESSPELFVADVYYKEKDDYGNEVTKLARPLPLEYLLLDVPTAFSRESQFTCSNSISEFPACNRDAVGQVQSLSALSKYLSQFPADKFVDALSDFHVLVYLATNDTISLKDEMGILLDAVRNHDNNLATHWSQSASWSTLQELMRHSNEAIGHHHSDAHSMDAEMREAIERSLQMQ
uniref:Nuclear protein localization protein 4 homolog n=1 Tax=Phallusia mammillata TaxID=59560 RepID=A0A6F9DN72_9ASCI|nr:nuclear protein localization protein 4 homolog [Phallusia mammillata]